MFYDELPAASIVEPRIISLTTNAMTSVWFELSWSARMSRVPVSMRILRSRHLIR